MTKTAVITPSRGDVAVVASFLTGDELAAFHWNIDHGQRLGQAFMNALPMRQYATLQGTQQDPFYADDVGTVLDALDRLTS